MSRMRIAVLFHRFGPYHVARLAAAGRLAAITGLEASSETKEYGWEAVRGELKFDRLTIVPDGDFHDLPWREQWRRMEEALSQVRPDVVAIPGWVSPEALHALRWSEKYAVPVVLMSESTAWDFPRRAWRERVKKVLLRQADAALVGGTPHADYLVKLDVPRDRIFTGYDVVDNDYFSQRAAEVRADQPRWRQELGLQRPFFLASSRFIPKKNLARLVRAYRGYRDGARTPAWDLVLLGDGILRADLESLRAELGLEGSVHLPGFVQYDKLPSYYGLAEAFVHASTTEQWGLVVNEAMASGLPVIVSNRCGCAQDLVQDGINGFTFDPYRPQALATRMLRISACRTQTASMSLASQQVISHWGTDRFAKGLTASATLAVRSPRKCKTWTGRLLLTALSGGGSCAGLRTINRAGGGY